MLRRHLALAVLAFVALVACGAPPRPVLPQSAVTATRSVAITFDDLPYAGSIGQGPDSFSAKEVAALNARIRHVLASHGASATGFVIERSAQATGASEAKEMLGHWTRGRLSLGNHSESHADVNTLDLARIEDEIARGEKTLRPLMEKAGKPVTFMRFPMNHTGDTTAKRLGIEALLAARGYRIAASTIDTSDYVFEGAYQQALAAKDRSCAAAILAAYLEHTSIQIDYYGALSRQVLGYEPPQIALLHLNRINAEALDAILTLYRDRGYGFVSLSDAQADPAYTAPARYTTKFGPM